MEKIDLPQRDYVSPGTLSWQIDGINLDWKRSQITIALSGENGLTKVEEYFGQEAVNLMTGLNKANLSVKTMHRRIYEKLLADGRLSGTVVGTPD